MTIKFTTLVLAATILLAGCSPTAAPGASATPAAGATTEQVSSPATGAPAASAAHAYALGSKKKGDIALCAVCAINDGATAEEAAVETIDYEGKTYVFCNEDEKAQFISTPTKFAAK